METCGGDFHFIKGLQYYYVCRSNCFRKLEKAAKVSEEVQSLVAELRAIYCEHESAEGEPASQKVCSEINHGLMHVYDN